MTETELNYKEDLEINEFQLEKEWLNQPLLYMKYAELCAEAEREMNYTHERIKICRSELLRKCKTENPKATAGDLEAFYRTDKRHQELKEELIEDQYNYRILETSVKAMYTRKSALENLTRLTLSAYYSEPTAPEDNPGFTKEVKQTASRNIVKDKMGSKTRRKRTK